MSGYQINDNSKPACKKHICIYSTSWIYTKLGEKYIVKYMAS